MTDKEKVIAAYICQNEKLPDKRCEKCPYGYEYLDQTGDNYFVWCNIERIMVDAIELLKAQEPMGQNGEQHQCNKCKFYQGVHNVSGHAPCSFWNIGGVMWNDYCSRFHDFRIGGEA